MAKRIQTPLAAGPGVEIDLWRPVDLDGLPRSLVEAVAAGDWSRVRRELSSVMDGIKTDGPYGRALLQLVRRVPIGIDPVFDRYRGAIAIDHGDWDELRECLAAAPVEARELEALRDFILAPPTNVRVRPTASPAEEPFVAYGFQLACRSGWYRRWIRSLANWDASARWTREDVPASSHMRGRAMHHAVLRAAAEAHAGNLEVAAAFASQALRIGDSADPLVDWASDISTGTTLATGARSGPPIRLFDRSAKASGMSPLGTMEWLYHVIPFLGLVDLQALDAGSRLFERIAIRLASPRAQLQAEAWRVAVDGLGKGWQSSRLVSLLAQSARADLGLRVLPSLLQALATRRYAAFSTAEVYARRVGNVWAQTAALVGMAAIDPSSRVARSLLRILEASGWRRPVLLPSELTAEAALGITTLGYRSSSLVELAFASGRPNVTVEVATRHARDASLPEGVRLTAIRALEHLGTTYSRGALAALAREPAEVGRAARVALESPRGVVGLSGREVEVLDLAALGLTNRQIAARLSLSHHTIARHLANARDKLGAANRADAAVRLQRMRAS